MNRWLRRMLIVGVAAIAAHGVVIVAAPYVLMAGAMKRVSRDGARVNSWVHAPRTTEASRSIVRPSPDLAYSACVLDLGGGPVRVTASPWGDYMSVSVFAANSDNVFVANDRNHPRGIDLTIAGPGFAGSAPAGTQIVQLGSARGIVLTRRLAPTAEAFAKADAARRGDVCARL